MRNRISSRPVAAAFVATALVLGPLRAAAEEVTVFAASSLTTALGRVAESWTAETGHSVVLSHAAASSLARQIQQGAPADIFISSSLEWMDAIEATGDLRDGTRRYILGNTLVLIAHGQDAAPVTLDERLDLAGMLGDERLAMALVDSVPAGVYGKSALTALGLWYSVEQLVAQADNVRSALALVAQNEAPLGIVYATDSAVQDNVTVIGVFPESSHDPITYLAGITAHSGSPVAEAFLDYLTSDSAGAIWADFGFKVLD